jgi:hypothetical protein
VPGIEFSINVIKPMNFEIIKECPKTGWHVIWGIVAFIIIVFVGLSKDFPFYSLPCPFHELTGFPCLTCGGTRCVVSLYNFDIAKAFFYNPLVAAVLISMVFSCIVIVAGLISGNSLKVKIDHRAVRAIRFIAIAGILLNWTFLAITGR